MSQQNGGFPNGQQPWKDQESTSATPHVFPFGGQQQGDPDAPHDPAQGSQPAPQYGGTPAGQWGQSGGAEHWSPQGSQPQQWGQPPQGQPEWSQQGASQPAYGQPSHGRDPHGSQPQAWSQEQLDQQWAQQQGQQIPPQQYGQQPNSGQPEQWAQPAAPFGSGPQHQDPGQHGRPDQQFGSQGQTAGGPPPQWDDPNLGSGAQPQGSQGSQGNQQFSGILDPHTGEIHPVPDLQNLDETDALLVVVSGPDAGAQILLDTDVVTVGRSPNADIFLDDVTVSRKHAEFVRTPSGFTLRDTGSLNGTYVGRQLIDSIELQNGADVQIGKFRMIFQQRPRTS